MSKPIAIVDAFTRDRGAGNRAGVVTDAAELSDAQMQSIAHIVGASETAFVLGLEPTLRLRYFTPTTEISFCGHATVATCHRLHEEGRLAIGAHELECMAGRFELELENMEGQAHARVWLVTPQPGFRPVDVDLEGLMGLINGNVDMIDPTLPISKAGSRLLVPLRRRTDLWALMPTRRLVAFGEAIGIRGFLFFTRDVREPGNVAHSRYFAPSEGILEDPVTGAANGPLGMYLVVHGAVVVDANGLTRVRAEQGDAIGKPGRVDLEVLTAGGEVSRVRIGGVAVTVMTGALEG